MVRPKGGHRPWASLLEKVTDSDSVVDSQMLGSDANAKPVLPQR